MNKKLALTVAVALAAATSFCASPAGKLDPKRAAKFRKILAEKKANRVDNGGMFFTSPQGAVVEIVNRQKAVPEQMLRDAALVIMRMTRLPIVFVEEKTAKAGALLELTDDPDAPSVLSAMDDGWAKVNLGKLVADKPDEAKLKERVGKQMWRGVAAALGVGVSTYQPCLMRNIGNLRELDACALKAPGPASQNSIKESSEYFGILPIKVASYRTACREGWAPAPTNDIQKAIWEKVHEIPKNPMKIEFDPKKGK